MLMIGGEGNWRTVQSEGGVTVTGLSAVLAIIS
jgi:hypothetical protein